MGLFDKYFEEKDGSHRMWPPWFLIHPMQYEALLNMPTPFETVLEMHSQDINVQWFKLTRKASK